MFVVLVVLSVLLAAAVAAAGGAKVAAVPQMRESATHLGFSLPTYQKIGGLELVAALGLLVGLAVQAVGLLAALGLFLLMFGALAFHVRAGDKPPVYAPAAVVGALALVVLVLRIAA